MFHLSEWLDKCNLNDKKVPFVETLTYLKSQETEELTNTVNRVTVVLMFSLLDSNRIFAIEK